jgi:FMN reductase
MNAPQVTGLVGNPGRSPAPVDVHFTPLLLELGAAVPARGLFVLEAEVGDFGSFAAAWADAHAPALLAASKAQTQALATT